MHFYMAIALFNFGFCPDFQCCQISLEISVTIPNSTENKQDFHPFSYWIVVDNTG